MPSMRSFRLLAVTVLAVILALSSTQSAYAQQISLTPTCGPPGTVVTVTGSGFTMSAQPYCDFASSPSGLVGPGRGTDFDCNVAIDGSLVNTWFIVAAGASGSYSVIVDYLGEQFSDPVGFSTSCPAVGGVVMRTNTFALVSPWLAVIASVVCIGTVVVVARKHRS